MRATPALIAAITLLVATALPVIAPGKGLGLAEAPGHGQPACLPGNAFESDDVRIWFHQKKGFVKVFQNDDDGNQSMYAYKTGGIDELDGANETLASMNLERAFPQTSTCEVEETDEWVNMSITITDDVKNAAGGGFAGEATVTFVYHFNKTANGAKFDLIVEDWPWNADGEMLAYGFSVHTSGLTIEPAENGVGFTNGTDSQGFITWDANATAMYDDGHNETSVVDSNVTVDGSTAEVQLFFTLASPGYNKLVYDPFVGVGDYIILPVARILVPVPTHLLPEPASELAGALI